MEGESTRQLLQDNAADEALPEDNTPTDDLIRKGLLPVSTQLLLNEPVSMLINGGSNTIEEIPLSKFQNLKITKDNNDNYDYNHNSSYDNANLQSRPLLIPNEEEFQKEQKFQKRQLDLLLTTLYKSIQVFLLRNGMSLNFLRLIKLYVAHLIEEDVNPLEDENLLSIQHELSLGYAFTPQIEKIINRFYNEPDNISMKMALLQFNKYQSILKSYLTNWETLYRLKENRNKAYLIFEKFIKAKYIDTWKREIVKYRMDYRNSSEEFNEIRLKSFGLLKLLSKVDTISKMEEVANNQFTNKFLTEMRRKYSNLQSCESDLRDRRGKLLAHSTFYKWKLVFQAKKFTKYNHRLRKQCFQNMKKTYSNQVNLKKQADFMKYYFIVHSKFDVWRRHTHIITESVSHLNEMEKQFIRHKTWKLIKEASLLCRREVTTLQELDRIHLRFFFKNVMLKRYKEQMHYYSLLEVQDDRIKKKYMEILLGKVDLAIKADQFRRSHLLDNSLYYWKLAYNARNFFNQRILNCKYSRFKYWIRRAAFRKRFSQLQIKYLLKERFEKWWDLHMKQQHMILTAESNNHRTISKVYIDIWKSRQSKICALNETCVIFVKDASLSLIRKRIHKMKQLDVLLTDAEGKLARDEYLRKSFTLWKEHSNMKKEFKLETLLSRYNELKNESHSRQYFGVIKEKYKLYTYDLADKADLIRGQNLCKIPIKSMAQKLFAHMEDHKIAIHTFNKSLVKFYFSFWKARNDELHELLTVMINEQDLTSLSRFLQIWSMKLLKITRNDKSIQLFRQRWDRAALRGFLLLWNTKTVTFTNGQVSPDILTDGNDVDFVQYLTPEKPKQNLNEANIPGSERMRRTKMMAIMTHYSKARRAIPSPVKDSKILNTTAKKKIHEERSLRPWGSQRNQPDTAVKLDFNNLKPLKPEPTSHQFFSPGRISRRQLRERSDSALNGSPTRRTSTRSSIT